MGAIANQYQQQIIDDTVVGTTYIGKASPGVASADLKWQITKIVDDGAGNISIKFANGSSDFKFAWGSKASYTY